MMLQPIVHAFHATQDAKPVAAISHYPQSTDVGVTDRIQPRTLKGFRDFLPETMMPREAIMETARRVYRRYGFSPIDTPALELLEVLTGKGSEETDRQLYRFEDHGGRQVGLRFDLTIPLVHVGQFVVGQPGKELVKLAFRQ